MATSSRESKVALKHYQGNLRIKSLGNLYKWTTENMRELTKTMKKYDIRLEDCSEFGNFVITLINLIKINRKSENVASDKFEHEVFSVFLHEHGLSCYNRPVAPLGHSILIPSQPVIAHSHY